MRTAAFSQPETGASAIGSGRPVVAIPDRFAERLRVSYMRTRNRNFGSAVVLEKWEGAADWLILVDPAKRGLERFRQ